MERLENEQSSFSNISITSPMSQLILQLFRRFTYLTAHSPTFPSLHLRHNSFSNSSVALPTSQFILQPFNCFTQSQYILQPFFRFSYVTSSSLNSPGEPPMQRARWLRGNARDSHSGGPGFKSRARPTWLRFLVVSSNLKIAKELVTF